MAATIPNYPMSRFVLQRYAAGYHLGLVAPSTAEIVQIFIFKFPPNQQGTVVDVPKFIAWRQKVNENQRIQATPPLPHS